MVDEPACPPASPEAPGANHSAPPREFWRAVSGNVLRDSGARAGFCGRRTPLRLPGAPEPERAATRPRDSLGPGEREPGGAARLPVAGATDEALDADPDRFGWD